MINLKNLIDFLPFEFKEQDTYKVDGKGILERFLEICGNYFQEDITKDIDNILDIIDIDKTQQRYLNYLWEFLGALPFARTGEHKGVPNLSDEQIRTILKYSISLLSRRPSGLRKTTFTHNSLAHRTTWLRSDFGANVAWWEELSFLCSKSEAKRS